MEWENKIKRVSDIGKEREREASILKDTNGID